MIFTEARFVFFFAAVFALHWALRSARARKAWLLACSYAFYAAWDWRFLSLIAFSTLVDYAVGLELAQEGPRRDDTRRRRLLVASLATNLGLLATFKYLDFFIDSAAGLSSWLGLPISADRLGLVLPVGISFFTFQSMSYSIDVYRGRLEARRSLLDFALFVAFFPQLVAGPIVRAAHFLPQLDAKRRFADVRVQACLTLFLLGFAKKACLSDNLAPVIDAYFAQPEAYTALASWIAVALYTIQIYCDFSGYSDMAIACAGLLGYNLCRNFDAPYTAANISEFWRRWHISLSSWLRDYLYIALGGNRGRRAFVLRNLMLTMLLGGLWHGAAWQFVWWGALHGIALVVHRLWREHMPAASPGVASRILRTALTLFWVALCWIVFRAESMADALVVLRSALLFESPGQQGLAPLYLALAALLMLAHAAPRMRSVVARSEAVPAWLYAPLYGAAAATTIAFVGAQVEPFIYFQF